INDERKQAKAEADSLRRQYEDQSAGRDFAAELDAATAEITAAECGVAQASKALESAGASLAEATRRRAHWQRLKDDDAALQRELVAIEGKLDAVTERVRLREAELAWVAEREGQRARLLPIAATEEALTASLREQEELHERSRRQDELRRQLDRIVRDRDGYVRELESHVLTVVLTEQIQGWKWDAADTAAPLETVVRLRTTLDTIDLVAADARAEALLHCQKAAKERDDCGKTYRRYLQARQELDDKRAILLAGGDPSEQLARIGVHRQQAQTELSDANAAANSLREQREQVDELRGKLRQSRFDDVCPTCARPFSPGEETLVIETLDARRTSIEQARQAALTRAKRAQQRLHTLDEDRKRTEERLASLQTLLGRLQASDPILIEAQTKLRDAETVLETALKNAELVEPPEQEVVSRVVTRADLYRKLHGKANDLARIETSLRQGDTEHRAISASLAELGNVLYDAARHREVAENLRRARDAVAALAEIEQEVVRRPAIEVEIASARTEVDRLRGEHDALVQARAALGFDVNALSQAEHDELAAQRAERTARDGCYAAQTAHHDAILKRDLLQETRDRIARLATRADCRARDADQLDMMVREFNAFEKYVAGRYGPILAETTSTLVGQVTDGRYDRVEFDESYGIEVYDGEDEKFPLATFSGGERDAIALCARLALSRMVGSQATSPPGFLVLDEVFGSLDRDRRARLLDLLGSLAGATDHFHQLFVISHVDDVQGSAVFDELWRVVETSEGASQIV
ncbi:MAG: hypothetical protein M3121_03250, partial [Chloroflexota bacterium]|nr:hypothetical protein [Chloroflexota bacterium]